MVHLTRHLAIATHSTVKLTTKCSLGLRSYWNNSGRKTETESAESKNCSSLSFALGPKR